MGMLMVEVFIQAPLIKKGSDRVEFEFLKGFISSTFGEGDLIMNLIYNNVENTKTSISELLD